MRSISRYVVLSLFLFVLPFLQADTFRAATALQEQDVSHLVPPTLSFANSFVQTLSDSGWSIERVGLSIYNGGMAGTTKAAWIKTDKGVLEVLVYETSAEVEAIQLKEDNDSTPYYHKYTVKWPNTSRPNGFEGRLPVFFTKYRTLLVISYDRNVADALEKLFVSKEHKRPNTSLDQSGSVVDVSQPQQAKSLRKTSNSDEVSEGDILRTDTSLVTLLVKIIGRDGKASPDMHKADFSVYENDVKQEIAFFEPVDRPFSVVLLIDSSMSVEAEFSEIMKATKVLVDRLRPDDQLVVATFNAKIKAVLKLAKIRNPRGESTKILRYGGPRIYDAMDFAASHYLQRWPGRKAVVVLTDGFDFGSFRTTAEGSLHDAEEYDALFYTVQYKTSESQPRPMEKAQQQYERGTAYLRELAEKTGGRYQRAEDMDHLSAAFDWVVNELSSQYSLGYYPSRPPQPGERRRIKVQISQPDLVVHTRSSYVFKSPETKQAVPK